MKIMSNKNYESPIWEEILIAVENGFATSTGGGTESMNPSEGGWEKQTSNSWDF